MHNVCSANCIYGFLTYKLETIYRWDFKTRMARKPAQILGLYGWCALLSFTLAILSSRSSISPLIRQHEGVVQDATTFHYPARMGRQSTPSSNTTSREKTYPSNRIATVDVVGTDEKDVEEELHMKPTSVRDLKGYASIVDRQRHLQLGCSRCAYISNSGQLLGTDAGRVIDAFPCVIRMNDAPTRGFEKDVGSKTTIRFISFIATKFVLEKKDELLEGVGRPKYLLAWGPPTTMVPNTNASNTLQTLLSQYGDYGTDMYVLRDEYYDLSGLIYENQTGINRIGTQSWLTTGWFTMLFARSACDEIHVFGMIDDQYCKKHPNSTVPYHYADPRGPRECRIYKDGANLEKEGHRFGTEKSVFARWSKQEPRIYFRYPSWSG